MEEGLVTVIFVCLIAAGILYALPYVFILILCIIVAFIIGAVLSSCGAPEAGAYVAVISGVILFIFLSVSYFKSHPQSVFTDPQKKGSSSANCSITVSYGKSANIRSGNGMQYQVINKAQSGYVFRVLEVTQDWYKIDIGNGQVGWVNKSICKYQNP